MSLPVKSNFEIGLGSESTLKARPGPQCASVPVTAWACEPYTNFTGSSLIDRLEQSQAGVTRERRENLRVSKNIQLQIGSTNNHTSFHDIFTMQQDSARLLEFPIGRPVSTAHPSPHPPDPTATHSQRANSTCFEFLWRIHFVSPVGCGNPTSHHEDHISHFHGRCHCQTIG